MIQEQILTVLADNGVQVLAYTIGEFSIFVRVQPIEQALARQIAAALKVATGKFFAFESESDSCRFDCTR